MNTRATTRQAVAAGTMSAVAAFALHLMLLPTRGLTDDDDFYAPAGIRYAAWLRELCTTPAQALLRTHIDAAFTQNHEHPPFGKLVMGLTHALLHDATALLPSLQAARAGTSLFASVLVGIVVGFTARRIGLFVGVLAGGLVLSLPRLLFHSEVATLDVPVTTMVMAIAATCTWGMTRGARAGLVCAFVFALGLLTKLNAPFALLPCVVVVLLQRWHDFAREAGRAGPGARHGLDVVRLPAVPVPFVVMLVVAPVLFVALWPWLWNDTVQRVQQYIAFHLHHYPILMLYDGEIWEDPHAPWHASIVHAVGAMPLVVVVLGCCGAAAATRACVRLARGGLHPPSTPDGARDDDAAAAVAADEWRAMVLWQAAFALGIVALSSTPRYGGEKLFMPFFPFACILAADGARVLLRALTTLTPRIPSRLALVVVAVGALAPGVAGAWRFHGFELSYFGEGVGGLRGAVARGMERTYYDVADLELAAVLDREAAQHPGLLIHFEPNHKEYARTYRWLRHDGAIGRNVSLVDRKGDADVVVLTHERRWSTYASLRDEMSRFPILWEKRIDGVPLETAYRVRASAASSSKSTTTP